MIFLCPALLSVALPATVPNTPTEGVEATAPIPLSTPSPIPADGDNEFKVTWKDGINFETGDKQFRAKLGGRIQHDWAAFSEDIEEQGGSTNYNFENGGIFRRVRLSFEALLYEKIEFKTQYEFVNASEFADVYVGYLQSKAVNVRVGQFKEPFSLEESMSANYLAFMERSAVNGMGPVRNTGAMLHGSFSNENVTYGIGVFKDENVETGGTAGFSDTSDQSFTARLTGLPVYRDEGKKLVHVGVAGSLREPRNDMFDADLFAPTARGGLSPALIQNAAFAADQNTLLGVEAATVLGPFWGQAEFMLNEIDAQDGLSDPTISGYYAAAGYFLTGESRGYKKSGGTFDKTKPKTVFGKDGGTGAFELALRYGMVEFEELRLGGNTFDDELSDITLGFNWYFNTNTRVMFNVVDFDLDSESANIDEGGTAYQTRFQVWL